MAGGVEAMGSLIESIPDADRLARIFGQAVAPAFRLAGVAAFVSVLLTRLHTLIDRMRTVTFMDPALPSMIEMHPSTCPHDCPSTCALEIEVTEGGTRMGAVRGGKGVVHIEIAIGGNCLDQFGVVLFLALPEPGVFQHGNVTGAQDADGLSNDRPGARGPEHRIAART